VFEATQRCYSYTFDRPLNYVFYFLVAGLLGGLGWILVLVFSEAVIELGFWAVAWSAGIERTREVAAAATGNSPISGTAAVGTTIIGFCVMLVRTVATSYLFAYFWSAATAIYLLMRYDVDQTELDEVHLDEDQDRFGLPPLEMDARGVPTLPPGEAEAAEEDPSSRDDPPATDATEEK
jgi:hypothetical protein